MRRFSERTGWERESNEFARELERARGAGARLIDLTVSNPTRCGFVYPAEWFAGAGEGAGRYAPEPCGILPAREAVCGYYRELGVEVAAEQVVLTAGTSEAYSYLFRLLCDAGDEVLAARPSYPLFDFLAGLEDVRLVDYPLDYDYGRPAGKGNGGDSVWHIDVAELERRVTERTRAVVVVHPNNPTGNYAGEKERAALEEVCRRRGLALIVDEVFLEYAVGEQNAGPSTPRLRRFAQDDKTGASPSKQSHAASFAGGSAGVLSFVLSGVSKVCALPQMKVSWMVVNGPEDLRREALGRLEMIADTFLSVSTPAQLMLPRWLAEREVIQKQVRERVEANLAVLRASGLEMLEVQGGWTAVVRSGKWREAMEGGVVVQPGEFYGLGDGRMVVSLIGAVEEFREGVGVLAGL